ncbi:MAG: hypothetical protein IJU95_08070 [Treponema sp.]|nr:hypothetical protein [Treponema sp.]
MRAIATERIMQEIREEIQAKGYEKSTLPFNGIPIVPREEFTTNSQRLAQLNDSINFINTNWNISPFCPLTGRGLKLFIKKAVRKLVRPSFVQNMENQRKFNQNVVQSFNAINIYIKRLESRINELESQEK